MPNSGSSTLRDKQRDRQASDRVVLRHEIGLERQPIPAAGEEHAELVRCSRAHRLVRCRHGEALAQRRKQLLGATAVQVADDAVVVEDRHLVMREDHREEIAVRAGRAAARLRDP